MPGGSEVIVPGRSREGQPVVRQAGRLRLRIESRARSAAGVLRLRDTKLARETGRTISRSKPYIGRSLEEPKAGAGAFLVVDAKRNISPERTRCRRLAASSARCAR